MGNLVEKKIDIWKKKLLDLGMRNRLLNFKDSRRGSLTITGPEYKELFHKLAIEEKTLKLPYFRLEEVEVPAEIKQKESEATEVEAPVILDDSAVRSNETEITSNQEEKEIEIAPAEEKEIRMVKKIQVITLDGDISTDRDGREAHLTAKNLRDKAKTIQEEQGVNVLYLAFGFLDWKDEVQGKDEISSPLILVPVALKQGLITDPYKMTIHEDEIVVNPTLRYKLESDYKMVLPDFDGQNEELDAYLQKIRDMVNPLGWTVNEKVSLSLLSFSKINMYKDLQVHAEHMANHPLIQGLSGEASSDTVNQMDFTQIEGFQHDSLAPESVFQVVDADSSQQDAILMSQKGASFVLQGPPGTGKSQTITNMIAQALGEGKKVLFVSEKMAALEVVYNRLASAGLADFCLVLHSNKANKREFLDSLRKVTELKPIAVKDSALFKLKELEDRRSKLNAYCNELHEAIEPMHQSVYDANGMIAIMKEVPDLIFSMEDVNMEALTQDDLYQMRILVDELGKAQKKLTEDYEVNTWRNTTIKQINHEIRHDLLAQFVKTQDALANYEENVACLSDTLGVCMDKPYEQLDSMADLLEYCTSVPKVDSDEPFLLFLSQDLETLTQKREQTMTLESVWKEATSLKQNLAGEYKDEVWYLDADQLLADTLPQSMQANADAPAIVGEEDLLAFLILYSTDMRAEDFWFTPKWRNPDARKQWLDTCVSRVLKVTKARNLVLQEYEKDILTIDYKGMLARFKTDYTSFFKFLNGQYKQDCNTLRALRKVPVKKLTNEEILVTLNQLKDYHDALEELQANDTEFRQYLGGWYQGEWTEFEPITAAMDAWAKLMNLYEGSVPEKVKEDLLSGMNTSRYAEDLLYLRKEVSTAESVDSHTNQAEAMKQACALVARWEESLKPLRDLSIHPPGCLAATYDNLLKLAAYKRFQHTLEGFAPKLQEFYQDLYQAEATDWAQIRSLLDWNIIFKEHAQGLMTDEEATSVLKQDGYESRLLQTSKSLRSYKENYGDTVLTFCEMYEEEVGLKNKPLSTLKEWAFRCQDNLEGLEDWLDFMSALDRCEEAGLKNFTDTALEAKIPVEQLSGAFLKRIQRLWLDAVMPKLPAVMAFRTRAHEEVIQEFNRLDQEQMKIAQSRIRERLIKNLPNMNSFTSARDEVGILNHEMGKQRKIMPVRKLFNSIPNLLPRLKPCMMMSPLSVSQFLESEAYQFDLVIFDEASQVKTENAIGAISRGKQAIIAGDMHQLPPTNFFNTTLTGQDDYDGEEEDDSEAFESVLDESGTVMPQLTLKWHYRSKNESLITFSNRQIYNNSLVTFPSPTSSHELEGVEYIYVPEGIYQRSSTRNNPVEAERVADEIFKLIKLQPNRSMGVITFSEAQQRCVEAAVIARRLANPDYEWYFAEGKEEPFFIKNLENVQGDERDIILFSIGYGKSSPTEELHMNFGPLNQAGGYRRLNVAITRAKFTIKLIGSILPSDMRISEGSPKGIRMLRDYIAYAQNGIEALEDPGAAQGAEPSEESFENAIRSFLNSRGYDLANQVGCSGYRIDMAVKHPADPERYIIGIECDGPAYHSSRTARERDRLRHSVLKSMGWRFYRVWSTDWVKDPVTEGEHLIAAIEEALKKEAEAEAMEVAAVAMEVEDVTNPIDGVHHMEPENKETDSTTRSIPTTDTPFGFQVFTPMVFQKQSVDYPRSSIADALDKLVEEQAPIHIYLVAKQIAPLMGSSKVTQKVKDALQSTIKAFQSDRGWEQRGDYLWNTGQTKALPKVPEGEEIYRELKYIAPEELAAAMKVIQDQSIGLPKEDLFRILMKAYGYSKVTASMIPVLEAAYQIISEG